MKKKAMVFALFGGVAVISLLIAFGIFRMRSDKDESTMESIAETNLSIESSESTEASKESETTEAKESEEETKVTQESSESSEEDVEPSEPSSEAVSEPTPEPSKEPVSTVAPTETPTEQPTEAPAEPTEAPEVEPSELISPAVGESEAQGDVTPAVPEDCPPLDMGVETGTDLEDPAEPTAQTPCRCSCGGFR